MPFKESDRLVHRYNPDLGPGRVESVMGRRITVFFPGANQRLTLASDDNALRPLELLPGLRVRIETTGEVARIESRLDVSPGSPVPRFRLTDGRVYPERDLWPLELPQDPMERLAALQTDRGAAWVNRLDGVFLSRFREASGLGSFLGGRIALFPHQLYVAEQATQRDPVRWLLADEVGLGKTIEACLILSRLLRTGRATRALVVAPSTLTVQWLGELYRKFHQTFVWLDSRRRDDVAIELGPGFNPFEAHAHAVIAIEDLIDNPKLVTQASFARLDLLVVDEAHRLERGKSDDGNEAYRAVAPLTRSARHVLLLSATPLEADADGFFRLLELVRPDAYSCEEEFLRSLQEGRPLPPCTSATRRIDIGGLPPRVPLPVDISRSLDRATLKGDTREDLSDPRVEWIVEKTRAFANGGEEEGKTLIFCHERHTLNALKDVLETGTRKRVGIFHEELSPDRRDIECAEFRREDGPQYLISTECGGEGRNFEFCRRLVMFDMPRDPAAVEQRIGRLDRINRTRPVEIIYFRPPGGFESELVKLYEAIGVFSEPLGGLERSLSRVEHLILKAERIGRLRGESSLPVDAIIEEVRTAVELRTTGAHHHLLANAYGAEKGPSILARVPPELDASMERYVLNAARVLGFDIADRPGKRCWYIEFGGEAVIDHLPGVPGGSRFLGTFDREEAVEREDLDFFASGHPLVEGLLQGLEDSLRGRAAFLRLDGTGFNGAGIVFVHRFQGQVTFTVVDLAGRERHEWARLIKERRLELRGTQPQDWFGSLKGKAADPRFWPSICQALNERVSIPGRMEQVAAVRFFAKPLSKSSEIP